MEAATANATPRDRMRPLRYLWRVPLLLANIVFATLICAFILSWAGGTMKNGREPFAHRAIRLWSNLQLRIFGFTVRAHGKALHDPVLFVANHTSWLDIVLLHSQRAACFVAKAEIARWPLVGWMAARGGTIFHRRGSNHSLASVMAVMVERLKEGRAVAVFPEGGTGYNGILRVFHARIFQAALDAEVPVQPVALRFARNGRRDIDAGFRENESFMGNLLRLLGNPPMDVEVHFLEPVNVSADGRRRMAETARERIALALDTDTPA
jgi:lyso-ornithine lipid O-acyltransferase